VREFFSVLAFSKRFSIIKTSKGEPEKGIE
jgi:hypothetical protein